ncbi:MAG: carboxypeptidase regulatory-like domain-containing protein, partial [Candidatus Eremiobacteraeota bacterium]|nr:carboxypeptidase regulatory-like domain-containing protein [Candidatus Eremiobacteraeota bacterium]
MKCVIAALLAVAILALSTPAAFAAGGLYGSLSGTVLDSSTRAPIAGASITAKSPSASYSATTDGSGHFTILGVASDTYTVSATASGHDLVNIPGVTVFGDQSNSIGTVSLEPHLATIARVTSRSASSAYQPTQTTDQYTINSAQIIQATGKAYSTN